MHTDFYVKGLFHTKITENGQRLLLFKITGSANMDKRFGKLHQSSAKVGEVYSVEPSKTKLREYFIVKNGKVVGQLRKSDYKQNWWKLNSFG